MSDSGDDELQPPSEVVQPTSGDVVTEEDAMLAVYRHDVHKARFRSHEAAAEEYGGVRVNEPVPMGADADAALLSRPAGEPVQTVDAHGSPFRISLLTGETAMRVGEVGPGDLDAEFRRLISIEDPVAAHEAWLGSSVATIFNESEYYPYTSLKFHTLLAAALLDNYRAGFEFDDLFLVADEPGVVVPHRTVLSTSEFGLRVTGEPGEQPGAGLGSRPAMTFADVWSRLPEHPIDIDGVRAWRVLDAELRRVRSWSAALQFIEEFVAVESGGGGDA